MQPEDQYKKDLSILSATISITKTEANLQILKIKSKTTLEVHQIYLSCTHMAHKVMEHLVYFIWDKDHLLDPLC